MTHFDPSARDELVAAYLDDEVSDDERAMVEADPELLARVEIHREIAALVAEPVVPPETAMRDRHIAAALHASATAPNVTSLAARKRRWTPQYTRVLGAAAAVAVVLFAGTLLVLNNENSDDTAAVFSEPASEPAPAPAEEEGLRNSGAAATGDGDSDADAPEPAPADEPAPAEAPAPADDVAAEETAAQAPTQDADGGDDGTFSTESGASNLADAATRAFATALSDIDALADAVTETVVEFGADPEPPTEPDADQLVCEPEISALLGAASPATAVLFVGTAIVAGETVEYIVLEEVTETTMIVLETSTCTETARVSLP